MKMEVGQKVYLKPIKLGNAWRRDKSIKEVEIVSIGRKYVKVSGHYGEFFIENGHQKSTHSSDYQLYIDKCALDEEIERKELSSLILNSIPKYGNWNVSLEKLRKIKEILEL